MKGRRAAEVLGRPVFFAKGFVRSDSNRLVSKRTGSLQINGERKKLIHQS
jgi:hypothetical protein